MPTVCAYDGTDCTCQGGRGGGTWDCASCPGSPPTNGSMCPVVGEGCSFSGGETCDCQFVFGMGGGGGQQWTCQGGTTTSTSTSTGSTSTTATNPTCPPGNTPPTGQCTGDGLTCDYGSTTCVCGGGGIPMYPTSWACNTPAPGCPSTPPTVGDSCSGTGGYQECTYGVCPTETSFVCQNGNWAEGFVACPG